MEQQWKSLEVADIFFSSYKLPSLSLSFISIFFHHFTTSVLTNVVFWHWVKYFLTENVHEGE